MKTTVKQIATGTLLALLLLAGNVKAIETKASSHEAIESTLQLENWMTDDMVWNTISLNIAEFVLETDTSMELENWMTDSESWNTNNSFVEEVEMEMVLEDWMINDANWNAENINEESELTVENWMVDNNVWK